MGPSPFNPTPRGYAIEPLDAPPQDLRYVPATAFAMTRPFSMPAYTPIIAPLIGWRWQR